MNYIGWIVAVIGWGLWVRLRKRYRRADMQADDDFILAANGGYSAGYADGKRLGQQQERLAERKRRQEAAILGHKRKKQEREDAMIDQALHGNEAADHA